MQVELTRDELVTALNALETEEMMLGYIPKRVNGVKVRINGTVVTLLAI